MLIKLTNHLCDHLGYLCKSSASWSWVAWSTKLLAALGFFISCLQTDFEQQLLELIIWLHLVVIMKFIHKRLFQWFSTRKICSQLSQWTESQFPSHVHLEFSTLELPELVHRFCLRENCHELDEKDSEYPRQWRVIVLQPSSPSGRILYFFPAVTRYWKDDCLKVLRIEFYWRVLQQKTFSLIMFPSAIVGRNMKNCTSSNCTLDQNRILLFATLLTRSISSSAEPNWWHQYAKALLTLNWFAEWTVWNKSSVFIESPFKWMETLPFSYFKIPRLEALILLNSGWRLPFNRYIVMSNV